MPDRICNVNEEYLNVPAEDLEIEELKHECEVLRKSLNRSIDIANGLQNTLCAVEKELAEIKELLNIKDGENESI